MPRINPEQLESEADELLQTMATPPVNPDTDEPGQVTEPNDETEPKPKKGEEPAKAEGDGEPGDKPKEPPPEDTGEVGLTLDNARERIRNAQARMHRATQEASDLRKKVASQEGELSAVRSEVSGLKQQLEALKQQPPANPDTAADDVSDAELQGIAEEYPQIAKPFIKVINALNKQLKSVSEKVVAVEGKVEETASTIGEGKAEAAQKAHFDAILAVHPDAFELFKSDDFQGWLDRQPPAFAEIMDHGTAMDVNHVFTEYKRAVGVQQGDEDQNPKGNDRITRARAAATPNVRQVRTDPTKKPAKPTFTRKQIADMPPKEFAEREAEIDEAISEGRITQ